jgi:hypothetical protein
MATFIAQLGADVPSRTAGAAERRKQPPGEPSHERNQPPEGHCRAAGAGTWRVLPLYADGRAAGPVTPTDLSSKNID